jgi:hypothetical protein
MLDRPERETLEAMIAQVEPYWWDGQHDPEAVDPLYRIGVWVMQNRATAAPEARLAEDDARLRNLNERIGECVDRRDFNGARLLLTAYVAAAREGTRSGGDTG